MTDRTITLSCEQRYILDTELQTRIDDYKGDLKCPANADHERILHEFIDTLTAIRAMLYPNQRR
jgi:hypothetical protein